MANYIRKFKMDSEVILEAPKVQKKETPKVSRYWIFLSISALLLAGFLSLFIMLGRTPVINEWMFGPKLFRRILVVHVNLALIVSFYSFLCGLFVLIPSSASSNRFLPAGFFISIAGVLLMLTTIFIPAATPILSNYIPVLNHSVFLVSLCLFGLGVALTLLNRRIIPFSFSGDDVNDSLLPPASVPALQSAAVLFLVSMLLFFLSWMNTSVNLAAETYFEFLLWGGGHILQFVNMAAAVAVWFVLLQQISDRQLLSYKQSLLLFSVYTLPVLFSPLLLSGGTTDNLYITGFTHYMVWGIFPVISLVIILVIIRLIKLSKSGQLLSKPFTNPYYNGLVVSITFIIGGFILGAMIRGSNTMVPAHYHATLGGITIAFMVMTYKLLDYFGFSLTDGLWKKAAIQPLLYGTGQAIFVAGLAYAGTYGLARKVFGEEQIIHTSEIYIGLGLLVVGGLIAISGGVLFLWIVIKAWLNAKNG
ncbi:MAG TPA: cbb3-type cytochrome c oxidase subunit I [Balneolaceae bacterium]|nr:cbb3-type cytochrome c oxidase subunit I [Balneolaceae bacterium]